MNCLNLLYSFILGLDTLSNYEFSNIVSAMRKDLISESNLEQTLLTEALFGKG